MWCLLVLFSSHGHTIHGVGTAAVAAADHSQLLCSSVSFAPLEHSLLIAAEILRYIL